MAGFVQYLPARVVKLVDTRDLKSRGQKCPCRFEPGLGYRNSPVD